MASTTYVSNTSLATSLGSYLTSALANTTFQPIGSYALSSALSSYLTTALASTTYDSLAGNQTISGNKTFSGTVTYSALTPSQYLYLNASGVVTSQAISGGSGATVSTTGVSNNVTYYPTFTTGRSTTATQLSYYTDSGANPVSYNPSSETLNLYNLILGNQITLSGLSSSSTSSQLLGLNISQGNSIIQSVTNPTLTGCIIYNATNPALTMTSNNSTNYITFGQTTTANNYYTGTAINDSVIKNSTGNQWIGSNAQTNMLIGNSNVLALNSSSVTLNPSNNVTFQLAGNTVAQFVGNALYLQYLFYTIATNNVYFNFTPNYNVSSPLGTQNAGIQILNTPAYNTLTTGTSYLSLSCGNATLGSIVATSNNAISSGTSQIAFKVLLSSGVSGTPGVLTTVATIGPTIVDNSTSIATTAYVKSYVAGNSSGFSSIQTFLITTSSSAWSPPTGTKTMIIKMVGGGGGGGGGNVACGGYNGGGTGTATTMSGSGITSILNAGGGALGYQGYFAGLGGVGSGANILNSTGGSGFSFMGMGQNISMGYGSGGGQGGSSQMGQGGNAGSNFNQYNVAYCNGGNGTGYGAGGGGSNGLNTSSNYFFVGGSGGGAGGYVEHIILNPTGTYNISIGSGGGGGTSGNFCTGGTGSNGCVLIYCYL